MGTQFIEGRVLSQIRRAVRASRSSSFVAVAYFAKGAAALLPLKRQSMLVVDASERTVGSGGTSPADLLKLYKKGVRVFSVQNLHAKVFVCGRTAFIGSANVSKNSEGLQEAVIQTTEPEIVRAAREFVRRLCLQELGPEALNKLQGKYRPPKGNMNTKRRRGGRIRPSLAKLRLAHLVLGDHPAGSEVALEKGRKEASERRKHRRTHYLDEFEWQSDSIKEGDTLVQLVDELDGPKLVTPPGEVIRTKKWSNGKRHCTFIFIEVPKRRRVRVDRLARRLGRGALKRLKRSGLVSDEFAERLRKEFV